MGRCYVNGLKEELDRLRAAPEKLRAKTFKALEERAEAVRSDAASRAPVKTGALRRSIKKMVSEKTLTATVFADYPEGNRTNKRKTRKQAAGSKRYYAFAQEFGTKNMPAHPFLYPAARAGEAATNSALEAVLKEVAEGD
jgi:HK97 gp10 family phage protein